MIPFRFVFAAFAALLAAGCAAPASPPGGSLLPPRDGVGAACAVESAPCGTATRCCDGMVCVPNGRLGALCRRPYPG
ncbi:MAG: hypothetical protein RJA99_3020 [Pseudomonadota bacterium]|jgi:hypothetical protein